MLCVRESPEVRSATTGIDGTEMNSKCSVLGVHVKIMAWLDQDSEKQDCFARDHLVNGKYISSRGEDMPTRHRLARHLNGTKS